MGPGGRSWLWLLPLLLVAGCATATHPSGKAPPMASPGPSPLPRVPPAAPAPPVAAETGQASWYGEPHHGRPTASGEIYDMHDLTAAHRTLPLGTRALITNMRTGQATEVRINDRGPFKDDRVLDLSYGAARLLGAVGPGVVRVRIQVIALPGGAASAAAGGRFAVQLGAFSSRSSAESLRRELDRDGVKATVSEVSASGETYYRVRVGDYADRAAAHDAARDLAGRGRRAVIVER